MKELLGTDGFIHFVIKTNNYCNLHCEHCTNNCDVPLSPDNENIFRRWKWELSVEDLVLFCEQFKGIGELEYHHLTGAETTMMHPEKVREFVEILVSYSRCVSLATNGFNLAGMGIDSVNKIARIILADHGTNHEHIEFCVQYLRDFYEGSFHVVDSTRHYELTAAMQHASNKGRRCEFWMGNPSLFDSVLYPCCNGPFIMLKNNDTQMHDELVAAGWSIHNDDFIDVLKNWRSTIPAYVIDQCLNNCWKPFLGVGQGGTMITLKEYDVIKKPGGSGYE